MLNRLVNGSTIGCTLKLIKLKKERGVFFMKTKKTKAPIIMQHELTSRCNNNCGFCYNPERCLSVFTPRETDKQKNVLVAKNSIEKGIMAVCLTGGEPLLMGEHFFEIMKLYKQTGCYVSINSNGRLINKEVAKRLADEGLKSALISIHGTEDLHNFMVGDNAFQETVDGIKNLIEVGIHVVPNFVTTAKNVDDLKNVGDLMLSLGVKSMTSTPFLPSWGAESHKEFLLYTEHYKKYFESINYIRNLGIKIDSTLPIPACVLIKMFPTEWKNFLEVLSPRVCMAGKSFGVVSPDGYFRSCIQAPYLEKFGGNVIDAYDDSWKNANKWAEIELIPEECQKCEVLDVCGGGCRTGCMWDNKGSVNGSTMYMGKALIREEAKYFLKRAEVTTPIKNEKVFKFKSEIKFRDEEWGVIVFNPNFQSFTIVSKEIFNFKEHSFTASTKLINVLISMGAVEEVEDKNYLKLEGEVLPGGTLLPRLGKNLIDNEKVYCLRADTGERYYF